VPLSALTLATVLRFDEPLGEGLLLVGASAGAPFLSKLAELAKGNLPFAVGAMVLLRLVRWVTCHSCCRSCSRALRLIQQKLPALCSC
jgi:predicted Na+-dependent transporter